MYLKIIRDLNIKTQKGEKPMAKKKKPTKKNKKKVNSEIPLLALIKR